MKPGKFNAKSKARSLMQGPISGFAIYVFRHKIQHPLERISIDKRIHAWEKTGIRNDSVKELIGSKSGQTCVIVGNGPSVRFEDLDKIELSGFDSFGANRIVDVFDRTTWRPTYISVTDDNFLKGPSSTMDINEYLSVLERESVRSAFFASRMKKYAPNTSNVKIYYINVPISGLYKTNFAPISNDPSLYVSDLGSVTHFNIQIAAALGYSTIYLYGVDDSYSKYYGLDHKFHIDSLVSSHVEGMSKSDEDLPSEKPPITKFGAWRQRGYADMNKTQAGYRLCKEYAQQHSIRIANITRGGKLEVFSRSDFDEEIK